MPPTDICHVLTDENSGEENDVNIKNLPASQLRAPVMLFGQSTQEHDSEDDIPFTSTEHSVKKERLLPSGNSFLKDE